VSNNVVAAVEAHVAAFNARDAAAVVEGFAEDAVFSAGEQLLVGRRGIRMLFEDAFAAPLRASMQLRSVVVQGDTAACELVEKLEFSGSVTEVELAAFYTVRGGLLARVKVYREGPTA
jgi:uncharacterized protein (TIGR02246 family)